MEKCGICSAKINVDNVGGSLQDVPKDILKIFPNLKYVGSNCTPCVSCVNILNNMLQKFHQASLDLKDCIKNNKGKNAIIKGEENEPDICSFCRENCLGDSHTWNGDSESDIMSTVQEYMLEMGVYRKNIVSCKNCSTLLKNFICIYKYLKQTNKEIDKHKGKFGGPHFIKEEISIKSETFEEHVPEYVQAPSYDSTGTNSKELNIHTVDIKPNITEECRIDVENSNRDINSFKVKVEEVLLKNEDEVNDSFNDEEIECEQSFINSAGIKMFQCSQCPYHTKEKRNLKRHFLTHKSPDELVMYKCSLCSYQAKQKGALKRHTLIHKSPDEVAMYKCMQCPYETKILAYLRRHQLIHMAPGEVKMFKCPDCPYESKERGNLRRHTLTHRNPAELEMYSCEQCSYQAKYKFLLKLHMRSHQSCDEITMFQCPHCFVQTKRKGDLSRHLRNIHKSPDDIKLEESKETITYQCAQCEYGTKDKGRLSQHILFVHNPERAKLHKCTHCFYQTKNKSYLKVHMLTHQNPEDIIMYRCEHCSYQAKTRAILREHVNYVHESFECKMHKCPVCPYESKRKGHLNIHMLVHKKPEEITMFQCADCNYKAKHKTFLRSHIVRRHPKLYPYVNQ